MEGKIFNSQYAPKIHEEIKINEKKKRKKFGLFMLGILFFSIPNKSNPQLASTKPTDGSQKSTKRNLLKVRNDCGKL